MQDKPDYRQRLKYVEQILFNDWDPIGVNVGFEAFDEYDSYAPQLVSMWFNGELTEEAVTDYLLDIERNRIGLTGDEEKARKVAQKLIATM